MKKALIAVVVLALIGGGVWWWMSRSSNKTTSTPTPQTRTTTESDQSTPAANTVTFDGTSFSPATLTVKVGTKVTFVNNSPTPVWPASDPHPTHTDLPGFDAGKGLGKGESYSFTFDKLGSWGYHSHLNSSIKGTVAVQ